MSVNAKANVPGDFGSYDLRIHAVAYRVNRRMIFAAKPHFNVILHKIEEGLIGKLFFFVCRNSIVVSAREIYIDIEVPRKSLEHLYQRLCSLHCLHDNVFVIIDPCRDMNQAVNHIAKGEDMKLSDVVLNAIVDGLIDERLDALMKYCVVKRVPVILAALPAMPVGEKKHALVFVSAFFDSYDVCIIIVKRNGSSRISYGLVDDIQDMFCAGVFAQLAVHHALLVAHLLSSTAREAASFCRRQ